MRYGAMDGCIAPGSDAPQPCEPHRGGWIGHGLSAERFDRAIEILLIALLAFCPLALGAVHAWSEQVVIGLAGLIILLFCLKLFVFSAISVVWTWTYVPIAIFLGIALFQLWPLSAPTVSAISPRTAELKTELLGDLPNADEVLASMPLSFYPRATKHNLRLVLAAAVVFVVVVNVFREPIRIRRLLGAIALIGGVLALLALAQDVAGNGNIYWCVNSYDRAYSGPFVNHSHYGQFMNLSIGAALALLLVVLHQAFAGQHVTPREVLRYLHAPEARTVKLLLVMIVVGAATVLVSLTRGGMISMAIAAVITTLVLCSRRSLRGRGWIFVLVALAVFVCVLWAGFDQVYDRLASLRDFDRAEGGRWQIVKDIATITRQFPLLGTGLGTHAVVFPLYDSSNITALAAHAENEYAQAAEETGLLGVLALIAFAVMIWAHYARSVRRSRLPIRSAVYGLGFGLAAISVHSFSDFGQHLPANALLTATVCGLLVALASSHEIRSRRVPGTVKVLGIRALRLVVLVAVGGAIVWALAGANGARVAEAHWDQVRLAAHHLDANAWQGSDQTSAYLFEQAAAAIAAEPDNIDYRHYLGIYQWLSLTPFVDPNTDELDSQALPWARRIVEDLHQARPLCPTFGALYCIAGSIETFVLNDPNGLEHIRQGYRLAPNSATACFAAARVDVRARNTEAAFAKLERAVGLDGSYFAEAANLCIDDLARPDLALQLAGENTGRLSRVADLDRKSVV